MLAENVMYVFYGINVKLQEQHNDFNYIKELIMENPA